MNSPTNTTLVPFHQNSLPELSFLKLEVEGCENAPLCKATFDFGKCELEDRGVVFEVGYRRAWLVLISEGFTMKLESRYGLSEYPQQTVVQTEQTVHTGVEKVDELGANVSVTGGLPVGMTGGVNTKLTDKKNTSSGQKITQQIIYQNVFPRGDDRWEFRGSDGKPLEGNLIPSTTLVQLSVSSANRSLLAGQVYVQQRDMSHKILDCPKFKKPFYTESLAKKKLAAIFLSKCLARIANPEEKYIGKYQLSSSILKSDGG